MEPSQEEIDALFACFKFGDMRAAETAAKSLTEKFPDHALGWKARGAIASNAGRFDDAWAATVQAARLEPMNFEIHANLGGILFKLRRLAEAEASYREAARLRPDRAEIHAGLGDTLRDLGRLGEAEHCYREALRFDPDNGAVQGNLGSILFQLGRLQEAEHCYREAIRLKPDSAAVHVNLGIALYEAGRLSEAESTYRTAIRLDPRVAEAHNNLGNVLRNLGRLRDAERSYSEAIRLRPNYAEAFDNLGVVLANLGRPGEAVESYRQAIRLKPNLASAHSNLGVALADLGRIVEAEESCRTALGFKSDFAQAHSNLGYALQALGRVDDAERSYREAIRLSPDYVDAHSNLLLCQHFVQALSPAAALAEAQRYGSAVSSRAEPKFRFWARPPNSTKLRIGFVSGDLRGHPVGYFTEGLFRHLDRDAFELAAFVTTPTSDELTARLKPFFGDWVPIFGMNDRAAAALIHQKQIQVLIDLSGHTAHNRLPVFSYKPAPVQVSWIGFAATTGLPEMDYFLGDPYVAPPSLEQYFSETIWNLPETWLCFTPPSQPIPILQSPALANGHVTFGCFGNLSKMGESVVDVWASILRLVPGSKLFLKTKQLMDGAVVADTQRRFGRRDISSERLILEGPSPRAACLDAYNRVDVVLDTFPYPGGTTTLEALWMGVPVLTRKGDRFGARHGESIAHNAGQVNWIAADNDEYVRKAVAFAADTRQLAALRASLRERVLQSPLFDNQRFARNFGDALRAIFSQASKSAFGHADSR